MSSQIPRLGLAVILSVTFAGRVMAQPGGADQGAEKTPPPVKPTGPAAKKADDLIQGMTSRRGRARPQPSAEGNIRPRAANDAASRSVAEPLFRASMG
jgi:hypothetical protein